VDRTPGPLARARLRWGLPDALIAWLAGLLVVIVFTGIATALSPSLTDQVADDDVPTWYLIGAILTQNAGIVLALVWISDRKGQGSLRRDFGLIWPFERLSFGAAAAWLAIGAALSMAAALLLRPIADLADLDESAQQVSKSVEEAGGVGLALLMVGIVVIAPVVEELLFRGALLRALQRRFTVPVAIFVSAAVFAAVHVVGDPGSYYVVPGLLLLGLLSGWQAARTGDLGRSVLLHMGFNLLSAISLAVK
jgi:membrane protease YdiL (CAAX protease family)